MSEGVKIRLNAAVGWSRTSKIVNFQDFFTDLRWGAFRLFGIRLLRSTAFGSSDIIGIRLLHTSIPKRIKALLHNAPAKVLSVTLV